MNNKLYVSRRKFMGYSLGLSGLYLLDPAKLVVAQNECKPTQRDIQGPFYRAGAPERDMIGEGTLLVYGYVMSTGCQPIAGALVDIWQADPDGEYDNKSPDFNYRARVYSDQKGYYQFYTDIPGLYPQRPIRHIHYRVRADGYISGDGSPLLITQQYFREDTMKTESQFDFVLVPQG